MAAPLLLSCGKSGVLAAVLMALGWNGASTASDGSSAFPGARLAAVDVVLAAAAILNEHRRLVAAAQWPRRSGVGPAFNSRPAD